MTSEEKAIINVVSYNILSSSLSKPEYHSNSPPEAIENETRFKKLVEKLEEHIKDNSILLLQEVSERWSNRLSVIFSKINYFSVCRNYGGEFSGYMGVMIAFPLTLYQVNDIVSRKISDTVYWPNDIRHEKHNDRDYSSKTIKTLDGCQRRHNNVLIFQLECLKTKKNFITATYHMPCNYKDQKFMDIHAGLLVRFVQQTARGLPTILSGDFNSQPTTSAYEMITTGRTSSLVESMFHNHKNPKRISFGDDLNKFKVKKNKNKNNKNNKNKRGKKEPEIDTSRKSGVGVFKTLNPMKSAYKEFLKTEPTLTNFSNKSKNPKGGFADCIDYIFITEEFEVVDVLELYESRDIIESASFPDHTEPSDHLLLKATLTL